MDRRINLNLRNPSLKIDNYLLNAEKLRDFLGTYQPTSTPQIVNFQPWQGYAGTLLVIVGSGFASAREDNQVTVGGLSARVVTSEPTQLIVITHHNTQTGDVVVKVAGETAVGPRPFEVLGWPEPGGEEDGPPYSFAGAGTGEAPSAGTVPPNGTAQVLVVTCYPTDLVPPNFANARQDVVDTFDDVITFYNQASYGALTVQVDVTTHVALLRDADYYHRANGAAGYPNIDGAVLDQLMAECAQGAVDQGFNLDDYALMVASVYLPGRGVRAWGGWGSANFAYNNGSGVSINLTANHTLGLVAQRHDADWGRAAHEVAHNIVDGGLALGEDVYSSDLVDPSEATAQAFDLMGNHDSHPLFSGFYMHQMGWYSPANVHDLVWDRNPFSMEFDLVAHGLAQNAVPNRYHLLRIKISEGLYYYVEVRQRPDPAAVPTQLFDEFIPLSMAGTPDGGVVITKVITGTLNNNQETRLITLLQENQRVMISGEAADDPLRSLVIRVVNDNVQSRPRICRVRVEWAQVIADTPGGDFDLRIEPWGPGWETEDIWIDRTPWDVYDHVDGAGNPTGNGDEPRPGEINRFKARIRNDGVAPATNVKVTHYSVEPPGVGDNGNWAPMVTYTIPSILANGSVIRHVNWVPVVGEHTCLKVAISPQLGEVTGGNNAAQENVFDFQPPAASVPEPVILTVAVRNPLEERTPVYISLTGVPEGYFVYFPHRWLWLDGLAERKLDLLIIPSRDISFFFEQKKSSRANIRLFGKVPRVYSKKLEITGYPGSWMAPIGGIQANVTPKYRSQVKLDPEVKPEDDNQVHIYGRVDPVIMGQDVRVDMTRPDGTVEVLGVKTDKNGHFTVVFNLENKHKKPALQGAGVPVFAFQAHIFFASMLAPGDSNIIWYRREEGKIISTDIGRKTGRPTKGPQIS